jgi:hypothetical protein
VVVVFTSSCGANAIPRSTLSSLRRVDACELGKAITAPAIVVSKGYTGGPEKVNHFHQFVGSAPDLR